jgi:translation initiation factor IF-1
MPEGEPIEVEGRVVEALPRALFAVEIEDAERTRVTAHVGAESGLLRVLPGDHVVVALSGYDTGRGRIVRRRGSGKRGHHARGRRK